MPSGQDAGSVTCGSHLGPPVITVMAAAWLTLLRSASPWASETLPWMLQGHGAGVLSGRYTPSGPGPGAIHQPHLFPAQAPVLRPRLQGSRAGVSWASQGPQQRGGRRFEGTQSQIHSDLRPRLQVSQVTKEAVLVQLEGHAYPAPSGTRFACESRGGAVTKGSESGHQ